MKILLIASNTATTPYPVYPLGLSMVASALKAAGHDVEQCDFLTNEKSLDKVRAAALSYQPDAVGISIRNIDNVNLLNEQRYIDTVRDIVAAIKEVCAAPVVLGGPGFSIMPRAILDKVKADYGIVGEGEASMVEFLENVRKAAFPKERIIHSGHKLCGSAISSAAYDPRIMQFYLQSGNMASVQTKRGCRHGCVYCSYPILEGHHIRPREARAVVDDIVLLAGEHQAKYLFFTDSVFNDDDGYYLQVIEEMRRRGITIPWTAFFKPGKNLTDDIVRLMALTGLKAAEIGADAATDETLKGMGKDFTFTDVVECNRRFTGNGVATAHYYMFGGPGENRDTVLRGIDNIGAMTDTVSFMFMGIRILPDTALYRLALREGAVGAQDNLLEPVYYIAPGLDKAWLEQTMTEGFAGRRNCIFPPDKLDSVLTFLHKMGYSGSLWDMILADKKRRDRKK